MLVGIDGYREKERRSNMLDSAQLPRATCVFAPLPRTFQTVELRKIGLPRKTGGYWQITECSKSKGLVPGYGLVMVKRSSGHKGHEWDTM
jgi:hypothetical protein